MAHESFEDTDVAHLLNKHFISIKVDREERPDIDHIYMNICTLMTGQGGWPLTIIMTPDKHPFYAATYIPKNPRFGHTGLTTLLPQIADLWINKKQELLQTAHNSIQALKQQNTYTKGPDLTTETLDNTYQHLLNTFDSQHGGFSPAPKFPTPHSLLFLLRYGHVTNTPYANKMADITLEHMRLGGIYDHIGYGFHRYSTDHSWFLPHFEKMLYDQALLAYTYTEAYQATQKTLFRTTAEDILDYVKTTMTDPNGGFYSAEDADSEGIEGKFYTWSYQELKELLTDKEFRIIEKIYNIKKQGNLASETSREQTNTNILHQTHTIDEYTQIFKKNEESLTNTLSTIRKKLYTSREKRIHPQKDTKILTDWNGLMIAAFAKAAQQFNNLDYRSIAEKTVEFIENTMRQPDTGLYHSYRDGVPKHQGYADDYAFTIWGLLELYTATFKPRYLEKALDLNSYLLNHFWDTENHGLFFTHNNSEELIIRDKQIYDGAYPSANSVHLYNLIQLARITGDSMLEEKAAHLSKAFSQELTHMPGGYTFMMNSLIYALHETTEVVIVGDSNAKDTNLLIDTVQSKYRPTTIIILKDPYVQDKTLDTIAPYSAQYSLINNKATAYVCQNQQCKQPTNDIKTLHKMLQN